MCGSITHIQQRSQDARSINVYKIYVHYIGDCALRNLWYAGCKSMVFDKFVSRGVWLVKGVRFWLIGHLLALICLCRILVGDLCTLISLWCVDFDWWVMCGLWLVGDVWNWLVGDVWTLIDWFVKFGHWLVGDLKILIGLWCVDIDWLVICGLWLVCVMWTLIGWWCVDFDWFVKCRH